jgi:hypothetical protein
MTRPFHLNQELWPCDLDVGDWPNCVNFNFGSNFWILCTRTVIFYMCASSGKAFLWVPTDLSLWPWLLCLTNIMKTLTMPTSFNSISYDFDTSHDCFLWQILLVGINRFDLVTLTFMFDLHTENFNLGCIFWMVYTRTLIFYMSDEWPSHESQQIWPCDLYLDVWPTYWKLTLGITFQSYVPGLDSFPWLLMLLL